MKKQILNLGKALSKAEQKVIHGGQMQEGGDGCAVYVKLDDGSNEYWSACDLTVSEAQSEYASGGGSSYTVTGYCCASCSHC